ncbi:MAG: mechanosensitive ion channel family protein [Chitinophagaceae bacterium]|nr:MAG: mechanosensitive ion channel family protein [Chitinophagaceae bacterium]
MNSFLDKIYWGNTVQAYLIALAGIFITWAVIRTLRRVVLKRVGKWITRTNNHFDDIVLKVVEKFLLPYIYLLINYQIISELYIHPRLRKVLAVAMAVVTLYFLVRLINHALQLMVNGYMKRRHETPERIRQLNGVMIVIKALVWFVGFIFLLGNLGYDVRTMIAGLGVGGIAIALAAQTVLGDLFSYFVIFFDKPFEIGDFVKAGDSMGTIEQIGIKTTRIRSLDGEQLVMSNTNLTSSTIRNYKRLEKRRVVTSIGVTYQTKSEQLREIPGLIKDIVTANSDTVFDRAHLSKLDAYSINFEFIYIIQTADFGRYMDIQQAVLLAIIEAFEARGIQFAYPTQTVVLDNFPKPETEAESNS